MLFCPSRKLEKSVFLMKKPGISLKIKVKKTNSVRELLQDAKTISDMKGKEKIEIEDLMEAVDFRKTPKPLEIFSAGG